MPLDEFEGAAEILSSAFPTAAQASRGLDGKTYALPVYSDAFGFAYNTDTFNAAGFEKPGATLDELRAQMQKIKADGIEEFPLTLGMAKQPGQFWSLWATLYSSGGEMFDEDGAPAFQSAESPFKSILEWYVAAYNDWKILGFEDLQQNWGTVRTNIRSGSAKTGHVAQYALTEFNIRPDSASAGKIKLTLVPGLNGNDGGTVGYSHGVGIAAGTREPEASWHLLNAYAGPGADGSWALTGARALDQGGRCPFPEVYRSNELQGMITQMTLGDQVDFDRLSEISRPKRGIKATWYSEWEQGFMTHIQDALLKSTTVDAAVTASADLARRLAG
jgi:ABC-type glycerol-3-phosphate transport system substrate-binding protein